MTRPPVASVRHRLARWRRDRRGARYGRLATALRGLSLGGGAGLGLAAAVALALTAWARCSDLGPVPQVLPVVLDAGARAR